MDAKRQSEVPIEQRFLMNFEHGPPTGPPVGPPIGPPQPNFLTNRRLDANCDVLKGNSEVVYHQSGAGAGLDMLDNSRHLMLMAPPGMVGPYFVVPSLYANHLGENLANSGQQNLNKKDDPIWGLNHFQKNVPSHSSAIDKLIKRNDDLIKELDLKSKEFDDVRKALASKSQEFEDLRSKFSQLTDRLNDMPDISSENYADDRLIDLAASDEITGGSYWREMRRREDDDDLMMKSVQCSELSVEPCEKEFNAEVKSAFDDGQVLRVTERGRASSGSNTSFEVVGAGFCEDQGELKRLDDKCYTNVIKQSSDDLRDELHSVKSQVESFEPRLEQIEALKPRLEQVDALIVKVDELSAIVHQGARPKKTAENAEFLWPDLRQTNSELTAAKWKLTEQVKMLERENENLKSCMAVGDVQKLVKMNDLEDELRIVRQHLLEAEARVRELELQQRNADQFIIQHGTNENIIQLTTENAILKTQIETYKEDFEVERRDREKLNSQKETLQRFYDTLRNDLDNARHQLRKYEDDITSLRIDNNTMRKKLREATEELAAKELKAQTVNVPQDVTQKTKPAKQAQNIIIMPTSSSALPDPSAEWKCQACTYKNSGQRSCCEICGTGKDSKSSLTPRGPSASDFSGDELVPDRCRNETHAAPLLSNLRNYGDIETD